jgi:hypothetical protein
MLRIILLIKNDEKRILNSLFLFEKLVLIFKVNNLYYQKQKLYNTFFDLILKMKFVLFHF